LRLNFVHGQRCVGVVRTIQGQRSLVPGFVGPVLLSVLRIAAPDWLSAVGLLRVVLVLVHVAPPVFLVNKLSATNVTRVFSWLVMLAYQVSLHRVLIKERFIAQGTVDLWFIVPFSVLSESVVILETLAASFAGTVVRLVVASQVLPQLARVFEEFSTKFARFFHIAFVNKIPMLTSQSAENP